MSGYSHKIASLTKIRVGIAGWANPPSHKAKRRTHLSHLAYYAEQFSCVEINSSFYRLHRNSTYRSWKTATPATFRFAVKMPRTITHECALRHAAAEVKEFFSGIEALQPKLGAVLIQLPPSLEFSAALTRAFFKSVPRSRAVRLVCEPRHASWFTGSGDALLEQLDISRAATDPAPFPTAERPGGCRSFKYFRWHGSPRMYYSSYSDIQIKSFVRLVKALRQPDAWCIFDNTALYAAWDNATSFIAQFPVK